MNRLAPLALIAALATISAMAQTDVLGAHNVYGRGCVACHAPHSGANGGNGVGTTTDPGTGSLALWGQNLSPLYGQTIAFGDSGKYSVTLPSNITGFTGASDPNFVIIACLSCHDGNVAKVGMMKGQTVETLPIVGGNAPTLLGNDGSTAGNYNNDHPVGPLATFGCGGSYNWDCTISATGKVQMTGTASSVFANTNYGFTVSLAVVNNVPTVTCTSCHNQHSEIVYHGTIGGVTANWNTSFFIRGPYTPTTGGTTVSNAAAQFCRNCHGGESNEMNGLMNVPTTGISHL
jgi:cytochrome c553